MKHLQRLLLALAALLLPLALGATPVDASPAAPETPATEVQEFAALERFLSMDDAQLERIQRAIARLRAMTPAERAALHDRMHSFHRLPPGERARVRAGWRDERDQADWPRMMHALPDAERSAIQAELQSLEPADRATRKHELLEIWRGTTAAPRSAP
ncbi:MAG TPA: DUF3106 domain-containing protein [Opitutaceae bacterium]|nr:DUF3106 domain-containing protein [Opitutaceae bacterium]